MTAKTSFMAKFAGVCALAGILAVAGCAKEPADEDAAAAPTATQPASSSARNVDWAKHGLNTDETRYSPLDQISRDNVDRVGLAWEASLESTRGIEATPIVVDGVMYVTSTWSRVFALDARTGEVLWRYDPEVPKEWAPRGCCDVVNRGVALDGGRVFLGTYDGRLIALDAQSGAVLWDVDTLVDRDKPYTITGAPRVAGDKVLIGNGGADFGVRGYVSAFAASTGELAWRFYTVPAGTEGPHEHPELELAADTWDPDSMWSFGGGGTVWDSMAYDAELNLVFVGTGNGAPWPRFQRSPAGGDNLFLSSILALDADTGRMRWYYQTTPGDSWDYTATQHIVLADIDWNGAQRKVLFQAPKNGFFYVIDRETGELLAADKYVRASWATHVDLETGKPELSDTADYSEHSSIVFPATLGGHNWHPMSFSDRTGLVYIPAQDAATYFAPDKVSVMLETAHRPDMEQVVPEPWVGFSILVAWDPLARGIKWMQPYPSFGNAGVLSTAGGIVIQGDAQGNVNFYNDTDGTRISRLVTGTGIIAPPVTYMLDGEQYIAIAAGYGGAMFVLAEQNIAARQYKNFGRVMVFKLDGSDVTLPPELPTPDPRPAGTQVVFLDEQAMRGKATYVVRCGACHGWFGQTGLLPDLRRTSDETLANLESILLDGAYVELGMPSFADQLNSGDIDDLRAYLRAVSRP